MTVSESPMAPTAIRPTDKLLSEEASWKDSVDESALK